MKRSQLSQKWRTPFYLLTIFTLLLISTLILHRRKPPTNNSTQHSLPQLPRFAYLISGSRGEADQVKRLLQSVYHPRNYYLLHLDLHASDQERLQLAKYAKSEAAFRHFRNVMVVGKADLITSKGPTVVAATIHALAILLKQAKDWDWFINLRVGDYPLLSQDDLLHIFSYLPRDLNFLEHTSDIGWKEQQRARPIIIDPGLYLEKKSDVFWAKEKRSLPSSFKLYTGSESVILTRSFIDFCIWGWDNLPRTILMYYANFLSSSEGYFHSVICNHKNYQNTTVNNDLHYTKWDDTSQQALNLTGDNFGDMVQSGAPFAHRFSDNDPVLQKIDQDILSRMNGHLIPGGWCLGNPVLGKDPCGRFGSFDVIKPSVNSRRFAKLLLQLIDPENFRSKQCN
ncbi:beta-glucuronosyltransferase GlcAT14C [Silene latifolia]|uniref:beta-glucuronosyltransferase GlcAT14C n=1 Tax=Silene latifolia TaxID=37657 RepID=UPI003D76F18F